MPSDKKSKSHNYSTRSQKNKGGSKEYKKNMSSDDDDNYLSEEEEEYDEKEYRNYLSKIFPSKYMKEKAEATPPSKNVKITASPLAQ